MALQTSVRREERLGRAGALYDSSPIDTVTRTAEVPGFRPGELAIRGASAIHEGKGVRRLEASPESADAIASDLATSTADQTFEGAVLASARMVPARNVILTESASVDWIPSTITVRGENERGMPAQEAFAVPAGGAATLTGSVLFSRVLAIDVPAQAGTGGLLDVGTGTMLGAISRNAALGLVRYLAARQLDPNATAEFDALDTLAILTKGRIWVEVEDDVRDGDQAFVRIRATGDELVGAWRNDDDGGNAVPIVGTHFHGDSQDRDGAKLAVLFVDLG